MGPEVQPLSKGHRSIFFYLLVSIFFLSLPFIFLYATGYRFHFGDNTLVSTGGLYVAAERTGAEIYIDNELVRETRVFRRAFYAQNIPPGTHRIHVQKEGHHTWVKDLPVYPHLVTEAQAFNLPLAPQIRVISPWLRSDGSAHLVATSSVMEVSSTTNAYTVATSTIPISNLIKNNEFERINDLFAARNSTSTVTVSSDNFDGELIPYNSKVSEGIRLYKDEDKLLAAYIGRKENMPYYYCAEDFEVLGTTTPPVLLEEAGRQAAALIKSEEDVFGPEVQKVTEESECDPVVEIDTIGQAVTRFDFFPGGSEFVVVALETGVFVVEVDDRAWQNIQPLLLGDNLDIVVEGNNVYIYDGTLIYEVRANS